MNFDLQTGERYDIPAVALDPAADVDSVPSGQPAADRPDGRELLLLV